MSCVNSELLISVDHDCHAPLLEDSLISLSIMCEVCAARTEMKSFLCRNAVHLGEELMKSVAELLKKKRHFSLGFTEPMPKRI